MATGESRLNESKLRAFVDSNSVILKRLRSSSKGKRVVLLLGMTGSGKSTLINFVLGYALEVKGGNIVLAPGGTKKSRFAIGCGDTSQTSLPDYEEYLDEKNTLVYDLCGFGDTRGPEYSLVSASLIRDLVLNAAGVRLVFVTGQDEITAGRGALFRQTVEVARKILPDIDLAKISSVIITRKTAPEEGKEFYQWLQSKVQSGVLEPWVGLGLIGQMSNRKLDAGELASIKRLMFGGVFLPITKVKPEVVLTMQECGEVRGYFLNEMKKGLQTAAQRKLASISSTKDLAVLRALLKWIQDEFLPTADRCFAESFMVELLRPLTPTAYQEAALEYGKWADSEKARNEAACSAHISAVEAELARQEEAKARAREEAARRAEADARAKAAQATKEAEAERVRAAAAHAAALAAKEQAVKEARQRAEAAERHAQALREQLDDDDDGCVIS